MALFQIAEPGESAAPHQHKLAVGIDLGIKDYAILSDGTKYGNPKFLEKMLSSYGVRRQADRLVRGVAQKTLNLKDLKEIIVFNIPLVEQNHFVQKCEVIESLKIKSKLALNQADDLFKSLQNQAFSGNL